ncbi:hypothetical protein CISIN_1g0463192mg, partial [Citrus sinensis]
MELQLQFFQEEGKQLLRLLLLRRGRKRRRRVMKTWVSLFLI